MVRKRVLIVDDSEIDRLLLENILMMEYAVETAENGYRGIEKVLHGDKKIDCILLDLHMPIMNGFGFLELLKDSNVDNIPIIIISTESTSENILKTYSFNATDFICKPFEPDIIKERVALAISKSKKK